MTSPRSQGWTPPTTPPARPFPRRGGAGHGLPERAPAGGRASARETARLARGTGSRPRHGRRRGRGALGDDSRPRLFEPADAGARHGPARHPAQHPQRRSRRERHAPLRRLLRHPRASDAPLPRDAPRDRAARLGGLRRADDRRLRRLGRELPRRLFGGARHARAARRGRHGRPRGRRLRLLHVAWRLDRGPRGRSADATACAADSPTGSHRGGSSSAPTASAPRRQATGSEVHDPWATPRANEGSGR